MNRQQAGEARRGDRVVLRNAHNELTAATVVDGLDRSGWFPKLWVRSKDGGPSIPWPIEDVFTDLDDAKASQARRAGEVT